MATSRFTTVVNVTSGGTGLTEFGVREPKHDRPMTYQLIVTSALVSLRGTNFFDHDTGVGSHYVNIIDVMSLGTSGLFYIDGAFAGYQVQVHSVAGSVRCIFGA